MNPVALVPEYRKPPVGLGGPLYRRVLMSRIWIHAQMGGLFFGFPCGPEKGYIEKNREIERCHVFLMVLVLGWFEKEAKGKKLAKGVQVC